MLQCRFCLNDTFSANFQAYPRVLYVNYCYICRAEYVWFYKPYQANIHLYTVINKETYRWTIVYWPTAHHKIDIMENKLWHVQQPGFPGLLLNQNVKLLKTFKIDNPIINPQNIQEKLKIMLLFL